MTNAEFGELPLYYIVIIRKAIYMTRRNMDMALLKRELCNASWPSRSIAFITEQCNDSASGDSIRLNDFWMISYISCQWLLDAQLFTMIFTMSEVQSPATQYAFQQWLCDQINIGSCCDKISL